MIKSISCSDRRFKTVQFTPGFNVVFADRTKDSTKKDSRNGLGKSTLIEIIHFCLGANFSSTKTLAAKELEGCSFKMEVTLQGRDLIVTRNTKQYTKVTVEGDLEGVVGLPVERDESGLISLSMTEWTSVLGQLSFGLNPVKPGEKYKPSFRGLISYFVRRTPGAYLDPFSHFAQQHEYDKQISNAFLLGLHWEDGAAFQVLKDREKVIAQIKREAEAGTIPGLEGRLGDLEAEKVQLEFHIDKDQRQISNFQVNLKYNEIEREASTITQRLHELSELNVADERLKEFYQQSLKEETEPSSKKLLSIYEEAGILFPDLVQHRFADVEAFHRELLLNRKNFLKQEIARISKQIEERTKEKLRLSETRSEFMRVLKTEGALEEFTVLQQQLSEKTAKLEAVKRQIDAITQLEQGKSALRIEQETLFQKAQNDYIERRIQRDKAISYFNLNSQALYSEPGKLLIEISRTGFKFGVDIKRASSQGIGYMKVFCYDLTLSQLWSENEISPGFLVHDSTIFDGVDERQVAVALQLAAKESENRGFQYICMLNTDVVPWDEFSELFDIRLFERMRLTDNTEDGGLLGFRIASKGMEEAIPQAEPVEPEEADKAELEGALL